MAVRTNQKTNKQNPVAFRFRGLIFKFVQLIAIMILLGGVLYAAYQLGSNLMRRASAAYRQWFPAASAIAPLFTAEVAFWEPEIRRWANEYGMEPNLLATVMQIESCGHPNVSSYAGAQGLFQVMPFHFESTENMLDPNTNAKRGVSFLKSCLGWANHDVGLAMACYNGGPRVLQINSAYWDQQVRDYYHWGTGIYADALTRKRSSDTLDRWLAAGGVNLCNMAAAEIGIN